jgi:hypothetical protein
VKRAEVAFEQELTERFFARVRRGPPPARLINQYLSARVARSSAKTSASASFSAKTIFEYVQHWSQVSALTSPPAHSILK